MCRTALGDVADVHTSAPRASARRPARAPRPIPPVISVAALPMSICPQAIPYGRPSSDSDLVRPVIACLVAV